MADAMRFTTGELMELDRKIAQASERALAREETLFGAMTKAILAQTAEIRRIAQGFAALDVIAALAEIAARRDWVRPAVDASLDFEIEAGRHPVVEAALVKDLGTAVEQLIPTAIADDLASRPDADVPMELMHTLRYVAHVAPTFSLRGGTRDILRGMIARGLGLR